MTTTSLIPIEKVPYGAIFTIPAAPASLANHFLVRGHNDAGLNGVFCLTTGIWYTPAQMINVYYDFNVQVVADNLYDLISA